MSEGLLELEAPAARVADGFLHAFTPEHRAALGASAYCVVDFETTGLAITAKPVAVGGSAQIGDTTWTRYKAEHGAKLNCVTRARVLTVATRVRHQPS